MQRFILVFPLTFFLLTFNFNRHFWNNSEKSSNLASIVCSMLNLAVEESNVRMLYYIYC